MNLEKEEKYLKNVVFRHEDSSSYYDQKIKIILS